MAFKEEQEVAKVETVDGAEAEVEAEEVEAPKTAALESADDIDLADRMKAGRQEIINEVRKLIIGQEEVIEQMLLSLFVGGNSLLLGVPGLAKTLLIHTVAEVLDLKFSRIQFTPDVMPSDITGTDIIQEDAETGRRSMVFAPGPIFANIVLADEINRTPPKTQAALMEAMEERQVTVGGTNIPIDRPFFVLATQNPIEQEGTYPLPVSQLDRFQQSVQMDYPEAAEEFEIVQQTTSSYDPSLQPLLTKEAVVELIALTAKITVPRRILDYVSKIVRSTRPESEEAPDFVNEWISWGAGPRGIQAILSSARSLALMDGRTEINAGDVHEMAFPALRHRMVPTYHAEAEGVDCDAIIKKILTEMPGSLYKPEECEGENRPGFLQRLLGRS